MPEVELLFLTQTKSGLPVLRGRCGAGRTKDELFALSKELEPHYERLCRPDETKVRLGGQPYTVTRLDHGDPRQPVLALTPETSASAPGTDWLEQLLATVQQAATAPDLAPCTAAVLGHIAERLQWSCTAEPLAAARVLLTGALAMAVATPSSDEPGQEQIYLGALINLLSRVEPTRGSPPLFALALEREHPGTPTWMQRLVGGLWGQVRTK